MFFCIIALSSALTAATASAKHFGVKVIEIKQQQNLMHTVQKYELSKLSIKEY